MAWVPPVHVYNEILCWRLFQIESQIKLCFFLPASCSNILDLQDS